MALDIQPRAPQHGAWRYHPYAKTGTRRLAPLLLSAKSGGITVQADSASWPPRRGTLTLPRRCGHCAARLNSGVRSRVKAFCSFASLGSCKSFLACVLVRFDRQQRIQRMQPIAGALRNMASDAMLRPVSVCRQGEFCRFVLRSQALGLQKVMQRRPVATGAAARLAAVAASAARATACQQLAASGRLSLRVQRDALAPSRLRPYPQT